MNDLSPETPATPDAARDYRATVFLPRTPFPMQAGLAKREPGWLARWQAEGLYDRVMHDTAGRPDFILTDGPPYANGDIHIGHAVNKVLKDMVVKAARLDGRRAAFVPGWDCHGLPIEQQVEKKHGRVGQSLDAKAFRAACRDYAASQVARQRPDFERLGVLADWAHPYLTMQPAFEAEQLRVLAGIVENGHLLRGFKPVHWCVECGSSLAEAEVEYAEKTSNAIDVAFPVVDLGDFAARTGQGASATALVIWTTTPWTIPANEAIAVNAELAYVRVRHPGLPAWTLVLAEGLVERCAERWDVALEVLGPAFAGQALEGLRVRHPYLDKTVPVILGEHVTLEAGTGLVHTAPAHGVEDYQVGRRYDLPVYNPVGDNGVFAPDTPVVGGVFVRKAEEPVMDELAARGLLVQRTTFRHQYPICWRHKTPLIFRATPQWFIGMDVAGLRQQALAAIDTVTWIPEWGGPRIRAMVAQRPDWCISRQRTWGVPLALFFDAETQVPHPETPALLRRVADAIEAGGLEAWFGSTVGDWLPPAEAARYRMCTDTLDVWFDSGSVHQASVKSTHPEALGPDGLAPRADYYLEGSDQHRGWFQSSLLTRVALCGSAPYRRVLTHGFTVDEHGHKMSKSIGNVVAPQQVTQDLGADVLRLWVSSVDYSGEIPVSKNLLARVADAYRRIRNTMRFLLGGLDGFDPARHAVDAAGLLPGDARALAVARGVQAELRLAYDTAQFHAVYHRLHNYCVNDLGGLYLDVLKDRLYTLPEDHPARRSAQTALWHIAQALVRWVAPVLSFTADEIWQLLPGRADGSIFSQTWYALPDVPVPEDWALFETVRDGVKKSLEGLRAEGRIGASWGAGASFYADTAELRKLAAPGEELRFWLMTSEVAVRPSLERPEDAAEVAPGVWAVVAPLDTPKCARCWQHRADVGAAVAHPTLCGRCVTNLEGPGEVRRWV